MKAILVILPVLVLTGCASMAAPSPAVDYKTQVIDSSCTRFSVIKIPPADVPVVSETLKERILTHDRAWVKACGAPAS